MVHTLAEILKNKIIGFDYVDKCAGIVQTAVEKDGENVVERFPVACNVNGTDCDDEGKLIDLVPDDTKKSVMYFEDLGGAVFQGKEKDDLKFMSRIRLVGWLNLNKLGKTDDCSITAKVVAHLMTRIETTKQTNPIPFTRLKIEVENQMVKNPNIFAKYTYAETRTQFLLFPYDYFAINFRVFYSINKNCVPEFNASAENDCEVV